MNNRAFAHGQVFTLKGKPLNGWDLSLLTSVHNHGLTIAR